MTKHLRALCTVLLLLTAALAQAENTKTDAKATDKKAVNKKVEIIKAHAFAARGEPLYKEGFTHFNYVNPDAPKGGDVVRATDGTFDSFNRYASRGNPEIASASFYDTLMTGNGDEVSVYYPLIAESIEYPSDFSWVVFHINPKARHSDGKPITAEDVVFTFNKLMDQGVPFVKTLYKEVTKVEKLNKYSAKFSFSGPNKESVANLVDLPIFPKHYWENRDLSEPLSEPPVGSGAYVVKDYKMGQYAKYERIEDYWAADLPSQRGLNNFNSVRYDYYLDSTVMLEAFKAGEYDIRQENRMKHWMEDYDESLIKSGKIIKDEIENDLPMRMQAFTFNIQKPIFSDRLVRQAINYLFDYEWLNKTMFYGKYQRVSSYFDNTKYKATGKPEGKELEILEKFRGEIPDEVFGEAWRPNKTDGSGNIRKEMRRALSLFKKAGWVLKDKKLVHSKTGQAFKFELLMYDPSWEKLVLPFKRNLERVGIEMTLRVVDNSQFLKRMQDREYDLVVQGYRAQFYPSPHMRLVWQSDFIDSTYNRAGVNDPVIDYLVKGIVEHQDDEEMLTAYGRAFDRYAMWNFYVIPQWGSNKFNVARWNKFSKPSIRPKYSIGIESWWYDKDKAQKLKKVK